MFSKISEKQVTRAIAEEYHSKMMENLDPDVIIIGGGPSGLVAAREAALGGARVVIVESNNYIGGGFWLGGFLMNPVTIRSPGEEVLRELGVPMKEVEPGLFVASGPHACSKLIAAVCDAGVWIMNMTKFDDLVLREENRVNGVVVNWTPISALPRQITCVDPIALEAKIVIDATGHEAHVVKALESRGYLTMGGMGCMWVEGSEDAIVEKTGEIHPGLIVCGMSVSTAYGLPRMGPTFGGMLLSGQKAGRLAVQMLNGKLSTKLPGTEAIKV